MPERLTDDLLLVGAGAIGSAIAYVLGDLPLEGYLAIVDDDSFGPQNWGTSVLVSKADYGKHKAEVLANYVGSRMRTRAFVERVNAWAQRLGVLNLAPPSIVLGAVDSVQARRDIQDLWPDSLIDGAIGDFPAQVSAHSSQGVIGCVRCLFGNPPARDSATVASDASGLSLDRVNDPESVVTADDVERAPDDKKPHLALKVGQPVCSVVSEAMMAQLAEQEVPQGFQPSVPFVAGLSASLVVAEALKKIMGIETVLEPSYQVDVLRGPQLGMTVPLRAKPDCLCVARRGNIRKTRMARQPFDGALLDQPLRSQDS